MIVKIYDKTQNYVDGWQPLVLENVKYVAPAAGDMGWVVVMEDGCEIILPLGVVIESFNEDKGEAK